MEITIMAETCIIMNQDKVVAGLPKTMRGIRCLDIWRYGSCRVTYTRMSNGERFFGVDGTPYSMETGKEALAFMREWLAWWERGQEQ